MPKVFPPPLPDPDDESARRRAQFADTMAIGMNRAQSIVDEMCGTPAPEPDRLLELATEFARVSSRIRRSIARDARLAPSSSVALDFLRSYRSRGKDST